MKLIREKYPNYQDMFSQAELESLIKDLDNKDKLKMFRETGFTQKLSGEVVSPGKAATAVVGKASKVKDVVKALTPRTKKGKAVVGGLGLLGLGIFESARGGETTTSGTEQTMTSEEALQSQQNMDLQLTLAQMQAEGIDTTALLQTPAGQQILSNPAFNLAGLVGSSNIPVMANMGVYVGNMPRPKAPVAKSPDEARAQSAAGLTGVKKDTISLTEWKQQFPIGDPKKLAEWKKTLVDAGVVSASAGLDELKKNWEFWGQMSMDSVRNGQNLTPYQLLAIQRGLWGGGGGNEPSYNVNLIKKENSRTLLKQFMEAETGRVISDDEANEFANLIRQKQLAKPTKTEVKTVKGKKVTVTTPGFGEAEAAKIAEQRAMQDPLYQEFQTANVFGSALEKALGVRG